MASVFGGAFIDLAQLTARNVLLSAVSSAHTDRKQLGYLSQMWSIIHKILRIIRSTRLII